MNKPSQELFVQFFDKILPKYRPQSERVLQRLTGEDLKALNFRYIFDVSGMTEISHIIEDLVMATPATAILHTCFQYLSRLEDQLERYRLINETCQQLWLYGIIDAQIPEWSKTTVIDINGTVLPQFWFVIAYGPGLHASLVAREVTPNGADFSTSRIYEGFYSFDANLSYHLITLLRQIFPNQVSQPVPPELLE